MNPEKKEKVLIAAFFGALTLVLILAAPLSPHAFVAWFEEDRWAEWATFFGFGVAAVAAALGFVRSLKAPSAQGPAFVRHGRFIALALFAGFVALEEISWGQRLLGFIPPESFLQGNYQQEFNFHNFLKNLRIDTRWLVMGISLLYGIVPPLLGLFKEKFPKWLADSIDLLAPPKEQIPWHGVIIAAGFFYPIKFTGEAIELLLGLLLAVDALRWLSSGKPEGERAMPAGRMALSLVLPIALGIVTPPLLEATLYRPTPEEIVLTKDELQRLADDLAKPEVLNDRRFGFKMVAHARIFTGVEKKFINFGEDASFPEFGREREATGASDDQRRYEYYVDPWGSPYWFWYKRKTGGVMVYTLGANRRRDTDFMELSGEQLQAGALEGDDLGVWIAWEPKQPEKGEGEDSDRAAMLKKRLPDLLKKMLKGRRMKKDDNGEIQIQLGPPPDGAAGASDEAPSEASDEAK